MPGSDGEQELSEIFREVDEDVRHDRMVALWQAWAPYIIGTILAIVIGVAGRVWWTNYVMETKLSESARFDAAIAQLETNDRAAGLAALQSLSNEASSGYGTLAQFERAGALIDAGNRALAIDVYDEVSADSDVSERLQGFARLLAAMTALDIEDDSLVRERLEPIAGRNSSWYYSANEILGLLDLRAGNLSGAQAIFSDLMVDPNAPPGIKQRAAEILEVVESRMPTISLDDNGAQEGEG